jgi:hypothetical protein
MDLVAARQGGKFEEHCRLHKLNHTQFQNFSDARSLMLRMVSPPLQGVISFGALVTHQTLANACW